MRMTVVIPDELGQNVKKISQHRKQSLSLTATQAFEQFIKDEKRKAMGHRVIEIMRKAKIDPSIKDILEDGRRDCDDRT
jgi:predicted transcriptional regulator